MAARYPRVTGCGQRMCRTSPWPLRLQRPGPMIIGAMVRARRIATAVTTAAVLAALAAGCGGGEDPALPPRADAPPESVPALRPLDYDRIDRARREVEEAARRREEATVLASVEALAASGQLVAGRMPAVFLNLRRNTRTWTSAPFPSPGERQTFGSSPAVFQYV